MKITTEHAKSFHGLPVFVDDSGAVMDADDGLRAVMKKLGWRYEDLAEATGKSISRCQKMGSGHAPIPAEVLNVLRDAI